MDELFNLLSSSTRIDKTKRKKKNQPSKLVPNVVPFNNNNINAEDDDSDIEINNPKNHSASKLAHIHKEQVAAFRRRMRIQIRKNSESSPDPICSFDEISLPPWWENKILNNKQMVGTFHAIKASITRNIEMGKWINPTPIQMQALPSLLHRRDTLGCAPTGSGKSGAFIIPILFLATAEEKIFYAIPENENEGEENTMSKKKKKRKREENEKSSAKSSTNRQGHIRSLILAPSRELAQQLHRELERLGEGKVNGLRTALLSKSNTSVVSTLGGKAGLDVLVTTPLRLVDVMENSEKGIDLSRVRIVVLDEADRLLDASDGSNKNIKNRAHNEDSHNTRGESSGSTSFGKTFLEQIDTILSAVPDTAVRSLFSATIGSSVRQLAESILRNPIDITISAAPGSTIANPDIEQKLVFVGKEEGKLLAIRQIIQKGISPPVIIFLQSKDRAQALFSELLYDGVNVDVIHAGRTQGARDTAVTKFRKGETWVLICTDLVARGVDFKAVNMVINYDLPESGVTYVHRIGRTGRAGRKGEAITLYTEADFEHIGTIANVMKLSGCTDIPAWVLNAKKKKMIVPPKRARIRTTLKEDKDKKKKRKKRKKNKPNPE